VRVRLVPAVTATAAADVAVRQDRAAAATLAVAVRLHPERVPATDIRNAHRAGMRRVRQPRAAA
jgi:hypothetical protein